LIRDAVIGELTMTIVLRLISIALALMTALTLALVIRFARAGGLQAVLQSGFFGYMTLFGWGIGLILAPLGSVQLWRFQPIGWLSSLLVFAFGTTYYLSGVSSIRKPTTPLLPIFLAIGYHALCMAILATKRSRLICGVQPKPVDQVRGMNTDLLSSKK
jgi:hypothetical protein